MIYLYHAKGVGRHAVAKSDFEDAIKWNPGNHMAYVDCPVYSDLGFKDQAALCSTRYWI